MKKNISVSEIKKLYKRLNIDPGIKFEIRKDLNTGSLYNKLNTGNINKSNVNINKALSYIY